jgi:hypothetical protein
MDPDTSRKLHAMTLRHSIVLALVTALPCATSFELHARTPMCQPVVRQNALRMDASEDAAPSDTSPKPSTASKSLEEKMASWEASEDEQRAATLGGIIPRKVGLPGRVTRTDQPTEVDGFDVGMGISGVLLFPMAVLLASFPFWIGNLDVTSVGLPPTS